MKEEKKVEQGKRAERRQHVGFMLPHWALAHFWPLPLWSSPLVSSTLLRSAHIPQ